MDPLDEYLQIAIQLSKQCGQMIIEWHQKGSFRVDNKNDTKSNQPINDFVTEVDIEIEKFIFDSLKKHYPQHRFIGEESVDTPKILDSNEPTWIIDPIDGTMNFTHYSPWCCVSIGLAINQELVMGVINCPYLGKLYTAIKGRGARCNDVPIHVSNAKEMEKALILSDIPIFSLSNTKYKNFARFIFEEIIWKCQGYRCIGSCCISMCFVADGSADAFFTSNVKIWDLAAGYVIIKEAGGIISNIKGNEFNPNDGNVLASCNQNLSNKLAECIKQAPK